MASDEQFADGRTPPERVPKSERILNLIAFLLRADEPVPVTEILGKVTGYDDAASRDSLMRRFERDKKVLRDMGIPVEHTGAGVFGGEGYRIPRDSYFLDQLTLPAASGKILRALFAWAHTGGGELSEDLRSALVKLGYFVDEEEEPPASGPTLANETLDSFTSKPAVGRNLELLSQAVFHQRRVRFGYRAQSTGEVQKREVDPYGLGYSGQAWGGGAWYLVGYCHLRQAPRTFKLERIQGEVATVTPEGPDYTIPPGFRVRDYLGRTRWEYQDLAAAFAGPEEPEGPFTARVRFTAAVAGEVRALVPSAVLVERDEVHQTLEFRVVRRRPFLRFLLRYVPRLEVLAPDGLDLALRELAREVLARYEEAR